MDKTAETPRLAELRAACAGALAMPRRRAELHEHVAVGAERVAHAVRAVSRDAAIVELAMGNYLEAVAHFVAGRELIHAYLSECALGAWETAADADDLLAEHVPT